MFWETNGKGFLMSCSIRAAGADLRGLLLSAALVALLYWYFGTEQGSAMRATGANPVDEPRAGHQRQCNMKLLGLALSNGHGRARGRPDDAVPGHCQTSSMGRGAIVIGLAAIIIGEVLCDAILPQGLQLLLSDLAFRRLRRRGLLPQSWC